MKSLPENEMFNALENRLRNFTEDPDDKVWNSITQAIPPRKPNRVWVWIDHSLNAAAIIALFFLLWSQLGDPPIEGNRSLAAENHKASVEITEGVSGNIEKEKTSDQPDDLKRNRGNNSTESLSLLRVEKVEQISSGERVKSTAEVRYGSVDQPGLMTKEAYASVNDSGFVSSSGTNDVDSTKTILSLRDSLQLNEKSTSPAEKKKKAKKLHTTFYLSLTPSLSYLKITPLENDDIVISGLGSEGIFSVNRLGFSLDAGLQHRFAKRWEAYLGFSYYQQNQQITYQYQTESVEVKPRSKDMTYSVTPGQAEEQIDYTMRNAGVAAGVYYLIKDGRLQHKVGAGLHYQHGFFKTQRETEYYNSESKYLSYQLSYRAEYQINHRVSAFLQPSFTRAIQAQEHLDAPFEVKPYRAGIGFGVTYRF